MRKPTCGDGRLRPSAERSEAAPTTDLDDLFLNPTYSFRRGISSRTRSSRKYNPPHAIIPRITGIGYVGSPIRSVVTVAPPSNPVSRIAPSTEVRGIRQTTTQINSSTPIGTTSLSANPARAIPSIAAVTLATTFPSKLPLESQLPSSLPPESETGAPRFLRSLQEFLLNFTCCRSFVLLQ